MKSLFSDLRRYWKHSSALVRVAVCRSGKFWLHVFWACVCLKERSVTLHERGRVCRLCVCVCLMFVEWRPHTSLARILPVSLTSVAFMWLAFFWGILFTCANCWMNIYWLNRGSHLVCFMLCSENYTTPFLLYRSKKTTFPLRNKHTIFEFAFWEDLEVKQYSCFSWNCVKLYMFIFQWDY